MFSIMGSAWVSLVFCLINYWIIRKKLIEELANDLYIFNNVRLEEGEYVVGAVAVSDGEQVLTITENGYGKRSPVEDYRPQTRGGKGIIGQNITEKTGQLAGIRKVGENDDLIVISSDGNIIRTKLAEIPVYGRASNGVRIMRFDEGVKVVNIATIAQNDEENENIENAETEVNANEE